MPPGDAGPSLTPGSFTAAQTRANAALTLISLVGGNDASCRAARGARLDAELAALLDAGEPPRYIAEMCWV